MKISIHRSEDRGGGEYGWLHTKHSFSFGNYYNPQRMNFGLLRVLNQDIIEAGKGFGTHPHDNMEIVTIVLEGALEHKDSTGGHGVIRPGEVQSMSAGSGVQHSEFNHSKENDAHILQIWIDTKEQEIKPRYEQKKIELKKNVFTKIASGKKKEGVYIHQDVFMSRGIFDKGKSITYKLKNKDNGIFVFLISGEVIIDKKILKSGDSAEITDTDSIEIKSNRENDILIIEVPME